MLNGLDLFSGIGGISLALSDWVRPVAYCENDRYAQAVLLSRMHDGKLPFAPIWDDVKTLSGESIPESIDIIYGGFPCQDISAAGNGIGLGGKRSSLFYEIVRLSKEIKPQFIFLENVPAIRTRGLDRVVWELSELGYDCRWDTISAQEVGANHKRERWFMLSKRREAVANTCSTGVGAEPKAVARQENQREPKPALSFSCSGSGLANSSGRRHRTPTQQISTRWNGTIDESWWKTEPAVGRVVDELPARVDRIRALGNAVVPLQAREAFMRLMGLKK